MALNRNKATKQNLNRKIVGAIQKHLTAPVTLGGVEYSPARLGKVFQKSIDVADATDSANKAWHAAVATEHSTAREVSGVQNQLRSYVSATYGEASTVFSDFGFMPRVVRTVDAATKAVAVEKREATRIARHTKGKRQRLEVTGETAPATSAPTAPATPAAPERPV